MTTQKKLKALVRARMQKSGESYTVARRQVLNDAPTPGYRLLGGIHPETATLANVLANQGTVDPTTNQLLSEAMILGIGGGLGAGYILWEFDAADRRVVTTGFRNQWQYTQRWYVKTAERLDMPMEVLSTSGQKTAQKNLDNALNDGRPAIAQVSAADLPYWHMPSSQSGWWGYAVVIYGTSGDQVLIDDRNLGRLAIPLEGAAKARGRIPSFKNRLFVPDAAATALKEATLQSAVEEGLSEQVAHLSKKSTSFSLPAFSKWAKMLSSTSNAKAWPKVFADGRGLVGCLVSSHEAVAEVGILGGNLRRLYADFLVEADRLLDHDLTQTADAYCRAATAWGDFAEVCLTPPVVREIVDLDSRRRAAIERGQRGAGQAATAARASHELLTGADIGLDSNGRQDLFDAMSEALVAAHNAEVDALDHLTDAIR